MGWLGWSWGNHFRWGSWRRLFRGRTRRSRLSLALRWFLFPYYFFFFGRAHPMPKFLGQGLNPCHSSNARSSTHWVTRELPVSLFLNMNNRVLESSSYSRQWRENSASLKPQTGSDDGTSTLTALVTTSRMATQIQRLGLYRCQPETSLHPGRWSTPSGE